MGGLSIEGMVFLAVFGFFIGAGIGTVLLPVITWVYKDLRKREIKENESN